ncbi:MAG: HutD family protein [Rhizobiales bacterium]|nr:HutD family protein [Hyphomicrobiales bacterium]MBI3673908.1 HutD family protein [Hyphomicrobiales bacterium]
MRKLTPEDYRLMPWKNSGGTTTEILAEPAPQPSEARPWLWRVSIAAVTGNGPFSRFPGYDRHIMAIGGDGFDLEGGPSGTLRVEPFHPLSFSGDWPIVSRLHKGPVRDFNLIADRAAIDSSLICERLTARRAFKAGGATILVHVLIGRARAAPEIGRTLDREESLLLMPGEVTTLEPLPSLAPPRLAICWIAPRA